jgi:hypothetical protein
LEGAQQKEAAAQSALDEWTESIASTADAVPQAQRSRRENKSKGYYATLDGKSSPKNDHLMSVLHAAWKDVMEKDTDLKTATAKLTNFAENRCVTAADFKAYGMEVVRPVAAEYKRLFLDSNGDYYNIMKANMAARVLNPLVAATMSDLELKEALNDLSSYGFDELRPTAIQDIISEIPTYRRIIASTSKSFWSEVDGAAK